MTTDVKDNLTETAREISNLPVEVQRVFVTKLCEYIRDEDVIMDLIEAMLVKTDRFSKLMQWMDRRFTKDIGLTPSRVAREAVVHLKINGKMLPFLIKNAQRIKDRVRHRISYNAKK